MKLILNFSVNISRPKILVKTIAYGGRFVRLIRELFGAFRRLSNTNQSYTKAQNQRDCF